MNCKPFIYLLLLLAGIMTMPVGNSQEITAPSSLKVVVTDYPPYVYKNKEGKWKGLSVGLWEQIAQRRGYHYQYYELPESKIVESLHRGEYDLSIAEITPTVERERLVDFTQPYLASRLAVAVHRFSLFQEIENFFYVLLSNGVFEIFIVMMVAVFLFGMIVWGAERDKNEHFSGDFFSAVGSALWFSVVTMTSIGYGDKVPQTLIGRFVTFIWMIAGMLLVALLTGAVVSSISTVSQYQMIKGFNDLAHYRNGVVEDGFSDTTLDLRGIHAKKFATLEEGLNALTEKKISAFVGDSISLQYLVARDYPGQLRLASLPSGTIYRMFALRPDFPYKEALNRELLRITTPVEWNKTIEQWTGPLMLGH